MKRISTIAGLCLAAAVVVNAIGAVSASALAPTLLLKITSGEYPATFASKGGTIALKVANGNTVTCTSVTNTGKLGEAAGEAGTVSAHLGTATIVFKECEVTVLGHKGPCGNVSRSTLEIKNVLFHFGSTLKVKTVEASAVPGFLLLVPGGSFSFECTEIPIVDKIIITVTGEGLGPGGAGVVGLVLTTTGATPGINVPFAALNLVFEEGAPAGTQKHAEFLLPLESNKLMAGINLRLENSFEKKVEKLAQSSTDTLEGFKNSGGGATNVEIVEG